MRLRTVNKRARRKQPMIPTLVAGRGVWFAEQPGWEGYSCLADGRAQPSFYRKYR